MSSDDQVDRRYWLEPNVGWSEELDLIAIEIQQEDAGYDLLCLIHTGFVRHGAEPTFSSSRTSTTLSGKVLFLRGIYRLESRDLPLIVVSESWDKSWDKAIRDTGDDIPRALKDQVSKTVREYQEKLREWREDEKREEDSWTQRLKSLEQLPAEEREKIEKGHKAYKRMEVLQQLFGDPPGRKEPRFDDDKKLLEMLSPAEWVSPLIEGEEAFQVQEAVGGHGSTGSRDGEYEALRMKGVDGKPGLLVRSWTPPNDGVASFPELKAALEAELPSAFRKPRSATLRPPKRGGVVTLDDTTFVDLDGIEEQGGQALEIFLEDIGREEMDEQIKKAREAIKKTGTEALGWYQPFHIWDEEHWGIYLHLDWLMALAWDMQWSGRLHSQRALYLLINQLVQHELFHAKTEAALTWLELGALKKKYLKYKNDVYENARGKEFWREEALANWEAMKWLKEDCKNREEIRIFEMLFELSPPGYSNWEDGDDVWTWRSFSTELVEGVPFDSDGKRPLPLEGLLRQMAGFELRPEDIPTRWVGKGSHADHLFRVPARKEMIRFLKRRGYELEPGGKHPKMCHKGSGKCFPVPRKDPVSRNVFGSFLTHFGIDKNEYKKQRLTL
jgi:hypothetical protein